MSYLPDTLHVDLIRYSHTSGSDDPKGSLGNVLFRNAVGDISKKSKKVYLSEIRFLSTLFSADSLADDSRRRADGKLDDTLLKLSNFSV